MGEVSEGDRLRKCEHCDAELKGDEAFCPRCGAATTAAGPTAEAPRPPREEYQRMRKEGCFGGGGGLWGAISGGVFIIGLGILWYFDWWFPGILFLIGIMIVLGGLIGYARR
ncbi:MAG: hypothetical protein ACETV0_05295 [Nitrososphaeria archaeon]